MASSSNTTHRDYTPLLEDLEEEEEEEEEEEGWLDLGLGLGFSTPCKNPQHKSTSVVASAFVSANSSPLQAQGHHDQVGLGLGLHMGSHEAIKRRVMSVGVTPPEGSNNYSRLWRNQHHHGHDDLPSLTLFTTTPPSWPWHLESTSFFGLRNGEIPVARRPQSGLWFSLRSSINRDGEVLPQIPKAYIRVKDENATVFMVKTYLVRKLGLSNEAEVDISCMGQKLAHSLTLKHVRDAVWLPRLVESVNSSTAFVENSLEMSINHLMSLHYGRRCFIK